MDDWDIEQTDPLDIAVENAYSALAVSFYRMRKAGRYQEEYDAMGYVISMLMEDRQHLREKYNVKI